MPEITQEIQAMDLRGIHMWLVLWKAYNACQTAAEKSIASLGMCYSDFAVLECLLHKGALPINAIGQKISLTSGSITTAIDRLERRGLVVRQNSQTDRRARIVELTPEGRKLIREAFRKHERDMETMVRSFTKDERQVFLKLLKRFGKAALKDQ